MQPLRLLVDALAARRGGTACAAIELSRALAAHDGVEAVLVVTQAESLVAKRLAGHRPLSVVELPAESRLELPRRLLWEATALPSLTRGFAASHVISFSGMLPRRLPVPIISHVSNPVMFETSRRADRLRRAAMGRTLRHSSLVITPTRAFQDVIRSSLEVDSTVVPLGVDHDRFFPAQEPGHGIVCVADFYPHKRHDLLIRAWAQLPAPRPPLTLVGDPPLSADCYEQVSSLASSLADRGTISIEPDLSQDEVADRYRSASVFALASEMESFNLPVVEAQACGLATVVREMPVLRETGGPSTIFVEGSEVDAWAGALERAAGQGAEARERGIEHAAAFTWTGAATQVHDAIVAA